MRLSPDLLFLCIKILICIQDQTPNADHQKVPNTVGTRVPEIFASVGATVVFFRVDQFQQIAFRNGDKFFYADSSNFSFSHYCSKSVWRSSHDESGSGRSNANTNGRARPTQQ